MSGATRPSPAVHVLVFLLMCAALVCTLPSFALDPNKRVTQYIHTSWRIQDGSAPAADILSIAQTSDGFLWFVAARGLYRFDGVRFVPWALPAGAPITRIKNIFGDHTGGLWIALNDEIVHLKGGTVRSRFKLRGVQSTQNISEDSDGSLWVVRGSMDSLDNPLCHITDQTIKCFGKRDGIPIAPIDSLLSDGKGGFWLGGPKALVHWNAGVSEMYPSKGQIISLVQDADGSLWVGILEEGPGRGLRKWKRGTIEPFATSSFDGSTVAVTRMISDRQGGLWVGTEAKGVFRVHGNTVEHNGHMEGLSSDAVWTLFEDREGIIAKHAIIEGREAVQGLRSSVLEKNDLALAIRTLGEELAVNSNSTAFQVNVEGTARDLHPIVRDEIYRITGEAMRNAFRHAEATQIEVEIHYDERRLRVRVRDDGKGVDEKLLGDSGHEGHFGLRGMRERATLIGGKLTVWSELCAGTEVELSVAAAGAYTSAVDGQPMSVTKKVLARISGRGTIRKS